MAQVTPLTLTKIAFDSWLGEAAESDWADNWTVAAAHKRAATKNSFVRFIFTTFRELTKIRFSEGIAQFFFKKELGRCGGDASGQGGSYVVSKDIGLVARGIIKGSKRPFFPHLADPSQPVYF
jgi:hypothetical protein